jgi:hypothetical protein
VALHQQLKQNNKPYQKRIFWCKSEILLHVSAKALIACQRLYCGEDIDHSIVDAGFYMRNASSH